MNKNDKLKVAIDFIADYLEGNEENKPNLYDLLKTEREKHNKLKPNVGSVDVVENVEEVTTRIKGINPDVITRAQEINTKVQEIDKRHYQEIENEIIKNLNDKIRNLEGKTIDQISDLTKIVKEFTGRKSMGTTLDDDGNVIAVEVEPLKEYNKP
tara:strand:- start:659 stop:1123 length:465 start_codon:yes stop_codon:yes gene_type:complete